MNLSRFLDEYLVDAREGFQRVNTALLALEKDKTAKARLEEVLRAFHTLKSSSAMIGFAEIAGVVHAAESAVERLRAGEASITQSAVDYLFAVTDLLEAMVKERGKGGAGGEWSGRIGEVERMAGSLGGGAPGAARKPSGGPTETIVSVEKVETVKVHVGLLDTLFNQVGELMIIKNRLNTLSADTPDKELKATLAGMGRLINAMQQNISAARLIPIDEIFRKFPRVVRDLARQEGKEVELAVSGHEIELDKGILDAIGAPLLHLLRNAVDHGIEPPEKRMQAGKAGKGEIRLEAARANNRILVVVEDDGAGIDIGSMKETAVKKGFIGPDEAGQLQEKDVIRLLFHPGFTSREQATGLSGRGVGLDVVKTVARQLGGKVEVSTEKGKGTRISLSFPLTTTIMQTLIVEAGGVSFALPSEAVQETLVVEPGEVKEILNGRAIVKGERIIPYVTLCESLMIPGRDEGVAIVLLVQGEEGMVAVGVDAVVGQMENIIKPFDALARQSKGFSGGTILGDGRVALLLDIAALFELNAFRKEGVAV